VTASDIQNGKPHPEPYLLGAKSLALRAEECVAIEDAPAGIRAAKAAGAHVIAVRTTTEAAELRESGANWILADLSRVSAHANGECLALTFTEE
jgi:sugar-phosphatase